MHCACMYIRILHPVTVTLTASPSLKMIVNWVCQQLVAYSGPFLIAYTTLPPTRSTTSEEAIVSMVISSTDYTKKVAGTECSNHCLYS